MTRSSEGAHIKRVGLKGVTIINCVNIPQQSFTCFNILYTQKSILYLPSVPVKVEFLLIQDDISTITDEML